MHTGQRVLAYTDYPESGSEYSRKLVPVWVVGYDDDKYVTIERCSMPGTREGVKRGYVYRTCRRRPFRHATLARNFVFDD